MHISMLALGLHLICVQFWTQAKLQSIDYILLKSQVWNYAFTKDFSVSLKAGITSKGPLLWATSNGIAATTYIGGYY